METDTEMDTETDMVTVVVTAPAERTVVMVTGTVVAMAVVVAAVEEKDVATERSPVGTGIKRGTIYNIYIYIYIVCVSHEFQKPISAVPFLVCACVFVYEVHSFSSRTARQRLHQIHNSQKK